MQREKRAGENAAGKWVRPSAFRKIDYDPENLDKLRECNSFDEAFAFNEECRLNGTGCRKADHLPEPQGTDPKEQLALKKAITHAVQVNGNKTRVKLERVEDGLHEALSEMREEMRAGFASPPASAPGHPPCLPRRSPPCLRPLRS